MRWIGALAATMWLGAALQPARAVELGELPPGAVSHSSMHGADEIITYVLFDPAPFRTRLPAGMEFLTLKQMAKTDAEVAAHLKRHPEQEGWAWSYFEIIGVRSLAYDGLEGRLGPHGGMAVWYPALRRLDRSDARPKGYSQLALGTWMSDRRLVEHMRASGYPADYGLVHFSHDASRLLARLDAPGLKVEASCRLRGPSVTPEWGKAPFSYQTVWTPAGQTPGFEVLTWGGHKVRDCLGPRWRVRGAHPFAMAFAARPQGSANVSGTEAAFGYELKGALYRR